MSYPRPILGANRNSNRFRGLFDTTIEEEPLDFLSQDAGPIDYATPPKKRSIADVLREIAARNPQQQALIAELANAPRREDYRANWKDRIGAGVIGGLTGYAEGPARGFATAQSLLDKPYNQAQEDYEERIKRLGIGANLEGRGIDQQIKFAEVEKNLEDQEFEREDSAWSTRNNKITGRQEDINRRTGEVKDLGPIDESLEASRTAELEKDKRDQANRLAQIEATGNNQLENIKARAEASAASYRAKAATYKPGDINKVISSKIADYISQNQVSDATRYLTEDETTGQITVFPDDRYDGALDRAHKQNLRAIIADINSGKITAADPKDVSSNVAKVTEIDPNTGQPIVKPATGVQPIPGGLQPPNPPSTAPQTGMFPNNAGAAPRPKEDIFLPRNLNVNPNGALPPSPGVNLPPAPPLPLDMSRLGVGLPPAPEVLLPPASPLNPSRFGVGRPDFGTTTPNPNEPRPVNANFSRILPGGFSRDAGLAAPAPLNTGLRGPLPFMGPSVNLPAVPPVPTAPAPPTPLNIRPGGPMPPSEVFGLPPAPLTPEQQAQFSSVAPVGQRTPGLGLPSTRGGFFPGAAAPVPAPVPAPVNDGRTPPEILESDSQHWTMKAGKLIEANQSLQNIAKVDRARAIAIAKNIVNIENLPQYDYKKPYIHVFGGSKGKPMEPPRRIRSQYEKLINDTAKKYGIDQELLHAVIDQESDYKADARSETGPAGIMQLTRAMAQAMGLATEPRNDERTDPYKAVSAGAEHLKKMLEISGGNIPLALVYYNQGETEISKWMNQEKGPDWSNLPPQAQDYATIIMRTYNAFKNQAAKGGR